MFDKLVKVWPSRLEPKTVVPGLYVSDEGCILIKKDNIFIDINGKEVKPLYVYQTTVVGERETQ